MGGSGGGSVEQRGYGALPYWAEGAHRSLIDKAESFAYGDRGAYTPYGDARIAGFSDAETQAQQARQAMYNNGDPASTFASEQLGLAGGLSSELADYGRQDWTMADHSSYMNPYTDNVVNPALREARESFDMDLNRSQADNIARGGSIGSYRAGLQDNQLRAQKAQALSDIRGQGQFDAYNNAQQQYNTDRQAGMQGLGAALAGHQATAAGASELGFDAQQRNLTNISELERSGAVQREMAQRELDLAYNDFSQEQNYPMQNMSFLSSVLSGVPNAQLAGQTTFAAQPGLASQLASLGLGAAGISQLFGNGGQ